MPIVHPLPFQSKIVKEATRLYMQHRALLALCHDAHARGMDDLVRIYFKSMCRTAAEIETLRHMLDGSTN